MDAKSNRFARELEIFRAESNAAVQFFYTWQTINAVATNDKTVFHALNTAPLFWNTNLGALQTAALVTLGRIFDPKPENHSVTRLIAFAHSNLEIFSKEALANRKREQSNNADNWLPDYLKTVYVPDRNDFRRIKRLVEVRRRTYENIYKPIRHTVLAHRSASHNADILFAKTNITELQKMLVFLRRLHEMLWQLFFNGQKPNLRPARYSVNRIREQPSHSPHQKELQERLIHETEQVIRSLIKNQPIVR